MEAIGNLKSEENSNNIFVEYFVAIDNKSNRICMSSRNDNFKATKINNSWKKSYPEFNDLMDNFSVFVNIHETQMIIEEARKSLGGIEKIRSPLK